MDYQVRVRNGDFQLPVSLSERAHVQFWFNPIWCLTGLGTHIPSRVSGTSVPLTSTGRPVSFQWWSQGSLRDHAHARRIGSKVAVPKYSSYRSTKNGNRHSSLPERGLTVNITVVIKDGLIFVG